MQPHWIRNYNVCWRTQSENSAQSMPCGGYDTGANVWVEKDELYLYLDKSGSFDENNQMLKLGRLHFQFEPPVLCRNFSQTLDLEKGQCVITGQDTLITIWFDTSASACHVEIDSKLPLSVNARLECWRTEPRDLMPDERMAAASYVGYPGRVVTWPDEITEEERFGVWWHCNRDDALLFDFLTRQQGLDAVKAQLDNPQKHLTFGGVLSGDHAVLSGKISGEYADVPFSGFQLKSEVAKTHTFVSTFYTAQVDDILQWKEALLYRHRQQIDNAPALKRATEQWWRDYWQRSYVCINPEKDERDQGWRIGRNYQLFRYMLGCNAYGQYPTKFNGGLFTTDSRFSVPQDHRGHTPDFRAWGGGSFTAQNQRLVYWGMLKNGDFDMMPSQFDFYRRALHNACLRTRFYWNHNGCSFTEQMENMGLPIGWAWGYDGIEDANHSRRLTFDPTEVRTPWLQYYYSSQLEFSYMILQYHHYSGQDISMYIPMIEQSVAFYFEHYTMLHFERCRELWQNEKLVIAPSTALENHKGAVNPMDAVAGLRSVIVGLCKLPQYVDTGKYTELLTHVPVLPVMNRDSRTVLAPAKFWLCKTGDELPQLYAVFPYPFYHVGSKDIQVAIDTWNQAEGSEKDYPGWRQGGIFTARLGLAKEAYDYCANKLDDGPQRFLAFWGPGYDWLPNHNWGGSGMIGLQEMLVQEYDGVIHMLPAWNRNQDVFFKLHLPNQRVIICEYCKGQLSYRVCNPN